MGVSELKIFGVILYSRLTLESHLRSVSAATSLKLGLLRRSTYIFGCYPTNLTCFRSFILPLLEYCSPNRSSAAACHVNLLDCVVCSSHYFFLILVVIALNIADWLLLYVRYVV